MKIKCVMLDAVDYDLTYGKVYEIDKIMSCDRYRVKDDNGHWTYMKEGEFEVVEEYTGEGLPPVGTVCEYSLGCSDNWFECEVKYHVKDRGEETYLIVFYNNGRGEQVVKIENIEFRPIKSQKQKEIRELSKDLDNFIDDVDTQEPLEEYLYNLGYRKTK